MHPPPRREQSLFDVTGPSTASRELVDAEASRIVDDCYADALETLCAHRDSLDRLASRLLWSETLDADQAREAARLPASFLAPARTGTDAPSQRAATGRVIGHLDGGTPVVVGTSVPVGREREMPMWTVVVGPEEREQVVRADALEVSGGALIFTTSGVITRVYAPTGYEWVRLEEE